jgi:DNA-binding NarL/FixJ family response regulator
MMPTNASTKTRILIVDDKARVRQGLRTILQLSEEFEVVGEAGNGVEAIRAAEKLHPEVVLMDLEMPVLGGLEATRRIKEQHPEIGVVILTIHGSDDVREQAARAGSDAFVEKEAPTKDLITAIREVRATSCPNTEGDES